MKQGAPTDVKFNKDVFNNPGGTAAPAESEDCLYLNVFAPADTSQNSKKSVLFWIFGVCGPSLNSLLNLLTSKGKFAKWRRIVRDL